MLNVLFLTHDFLKYLKFIIVHRDGGLNNIQIISGLQSPHFSHDYNLFPKKNGLGTYQFSSINAALMTLDSIYQTFYNLFCCLFLSQKFDFKLRHILVFCLVLLYLKCNHSFHEGST